MPIDAPFPNSPPSKPALPRNDDIPPPLLDDDYMQLDDTKHRVFIHNIDAELSDSEAEEGEAADGRLTLIPEMERHLRRTNLLSPVAALDSAPLSTKNNKLVLYRAPSSLSVPPEMDGVRMAVIEARERARAKRDVGGGPVHGVVRQAADARARSDNSSMMDIDVDWRDVVRSGEETATASRMRVVEEDDTEDPDPMDIDEG